MGLSLNLDFSGIEEFEKIFAALKNDREPSGEGWNSLFSTPGYRALIDNEFDRDFFKNYFTLAFMPSKIGTLEKKMREEDIVSRFLQHYVYVKNMYEELPRVTNEVRATIKSHESKIFDMTGMYLPKNIMGEYEPPIVSFVIFGYDARGYLPIVVDLVFAEDIGTFLIYMIAHEMHHFYRNKIAKLHLPSVQDNEFPVIWLLNQMEAEGIADLIDKPHLLSLDEIKSKFLHTWKTKFSENLKRSDNIIRIVDRILGNLPESSFERKIVSDLLKSIPMSGHIIGYHMATTIWEVYGENIISCVGDPLKFILLYNEAAESLGRFTFSYKSIDIISTLLERYITV